MSYALARAHIIAIIEGVTPTANKLWGTSKFAHAPEADEGDDLKSRSFWIESNVDGDGTVAMPFTPDISGQPRMTASMSVTIRYRAVEGDRANFDVGLETDAVDVAKALLTPTNWGSRATTKLDYLLDVRVRRLKLDDGGAEMRFSFEMHYVS